MQFRWWPQRDSCGSGPRSHILDSRRGHPSLANTAPTGIDGRLNGRLKFQIDGIAFLVA
jgi:hypothetical protein